MSSSAGKDKEEEPMRLTYFDDRLFSTPPIAAKQLFREVTRMGELVKANYRVRHGLLLPAEGRIAGRI